MQYHSVGKMNCYTNHIQGDKSQSSRHKPITVTSCVVKVMESVVYNHYYIHI